MRFFLSILFGLVLTGFATAAAPKAGPTEPNVAISSFIPADVLAAINNISVEDRDKACVANLDVRHRLASTQPQVALSGLTSQMYNTSDLLVSLDDFGGASSAIFTSAFVRHSDADKDLLMAALYRWAKAGAYLDTKVCANGGGACGGEWHSQRGTEKSPIKDYQSVEERLVPVAFAYDLILRDYKRTELADQHALIEKWLGLFLKRLPDTGKSTKSKVGFGFGNNWQTWGYPLLDLQNGDTVSFRARLANLARRIDPLVHADGSMEERTDRGARALWYHQTALQELMFALEMLKANGIDLYPQMAERIDKAVGIYLDAVEDVESGRNTKANPARIYQWAKADFHSAGDPHVQFWNRSEGTAVADWGSWIFVYLYRFPDASNAMRLRHFVASYDHLPMRDEAAGINTGCLYRLAVPDLEKREVSERPAVADSVVAALTESIDKPPTPEATETISLAALKISQSQTWDTGAEYKVQLIGTKLGDKPKGTVSFTILTDFKDKSRSPASLQLLRISAEDWRLNDSQSRPGDMPGCGDLAGHGDTFRLHYGRESKLNGCVLDNMGPADRLLWSSVFKQIPELVEHAAASDPVAASLDKLFVHKVAEK